MHFQTNDGLIFRARFYRSTHKLIPFFQNGQTSPALYTLASRASATKERVLLPPENPLSPGRPPNAIHQPAPLGREGAPLCPRNPSVNLPSPLAGEGTAADAFTSRSRPGEGAVRLPGTSSAAPGPGRNEGISSAFLDLACFSFQNTLLSLRLSRIFAFSGQKRDLLSGIVSSAPLFSYTSPEVPSFLTSLGVSAPLLDLAEAHG